MSKRDTVRLAKTLLANPDIQLMEICPSAKSKMAGEVFGRQDCKWISDAIRVPRKVQSTVARSKDVENRVARYLWGKDATRTWKDEEDLRWDTHPRMIGEVKNYYAENIFNAGGPWELLSSAMDQVCLALHDRDDHAHFPFAVLVPVGTRSLDRALTMVPSVEALDLYLRDEEEEEIEAQDTLSVLRVPEVIIPLGTLADMIRGDFLTIELVELADAWAQERSELAEKMATRC